MASVVLRQTFVTLPKAARVIVEIPKYRPANQKSAFSGRSSDIMKRGVRVEHVTLSHQPQFLLMA